ncbi:hypothetical protein PMAYCL1PPCAC_25230, partial [Pristionchus mayeri]
LLTRKIESSTVEVCLVRRTFDTRPWSVDVCAQFKLVGSSEEWNRESEIRETFDNDHSRWGIAEFIQWSDLLDKEQGFLGECGMITVEARFILSNIVGI